MLSPLCYALVILLKCIEHGCLLCDSNWSDTQKTSTEDWQYQYTLSVRRTVNQELQELQINNKNEAEVSQQFVYSLEDSEFPARLFRMSLAA